MAAKKQKAIDWEDIARAVEGTCQSLAAIQERYDLDDYDIDEIEERLLDFNIEACPGCHWWMECCELVNEDDEPVGCDQCR